jgi:hypothetical protein
MENSYSNSSDTTGKPELSDPEGRFVVRDGIWYAMVDGIYELQYQERDQHITMVGCAFITEKEAGLTMVGHTTVDYKCQRTGWASYIMPTICRLWNKCGRLKTYLLNTVSRIRG